MIPLRTEVEQKLLEMVAERQQAPKGLPVLLTPLSQELQQPREEAARAIDSLCRAGLSVISQKELDIGNTRAISKMIY